MTISYRSNRVLKILAASFLLAFSAHSLAQSARSVPMTDQEWKAVQAAAVKEGKVIFYGDPPAATLAKIRADFELANPGIVMESSRLFGPTLITRFETERATGIADGADVVVATDLMAWYEEPARLGQIKAPTGPASRSWPAEYLLAGVFPVLTVEPAVIAYNSNLVKTPITGYQDLLKPEFKGKVATSSLIAQVIVAWYDWLEKTQGADFLTKFAAQNPRILTGGTPAIQSTIAGEVLISAWMGSSTALPLIEKGAPIKMVVPNPSIGFRYGGAILSWAKRPNAALVLMDYLMSRRGQTVWSGSGGSASPLAGIPGSLDVKTINPYDPKQYSADVQKAYAVKWEKIFVAK